MTDEGDDGDLRIATGLLRCGRKAASRQAPGSAAADRPAFQDAVELKPQLVMEPHRVMLLHALLSHSSVRPRGLVQAFVSGFAAHVDGIPEGSRRPELGITLADAT